MYLKFEFTWHDQRKNHFKPNANTHQKNKLETT